LQVAGTIVSSGLGSREAIVPGLGGASEATLWSLHNLASQVRREDGKLFDPKSIAIHDSIDYDFGCQFGEPAGDLAVRAATVNRALIIRLEGHLDGIVVSLAEDLDSQPSRVNNSQMRWLSMGLPDAVPLRVHFLATHRSVPAHQSQCEPK
jgi:hypothetical protein